LILSAGVCERQNPFLKNTVSLVKLGFPKNVALYAKNGNNKKSKKGKKGQPKKKS